MNSKLSFSPFSFSFEFVLFFFSFWNRFCLFPLLFFKKKWGNKEEEKENTIPKEIKKKQKRKKETCPASEPSANLRRSRISLSVNLSPPNSVKISRNCFCGMKPVMCGSKHSKAWTISSAGSNWDIRSANIVWNSVKEMLSVLPEEEASFIISFNSASVGLKPRALISVFKDSLVRRSWPWAKRWNAASNSPSCSWEMEDIFEKESTKKRTTHKTQPHHKTQRKFLPPKIQMGPIWGDLRIWAVKKEYHHSNFSGHLFFEVLIFFWAWFFEGMGSILWKALFFFWFFFLFFFREKRKDKREKTEKEREKEKKRERGKEEFWFRGWFRGFFLWRKERHLKNGLFCLVFCFVFVRFILIFLFYFSLSFFSFQEKSMDWIGKQLDKVVDPDKMVDRLSYIAFLVIKTLQPFLIALHFGISLFSFSSSIQKLNKTEQKTKI